MSISKIEERVINVVQEVLKVDRSKLQMSSKFKEDLGADSLDQVSLIMALESEFKGSISDDDAGKMLTISDAISYIQKMGNEEKVS
jgi:acyl carrier protein